MTDWPDLLRRLDGKLFALADEFDLEALGATDPARLVSRTLTSPGATAASIAAREDHLGTKLPEDYRSFLSTTNGLLGLAGLPHGICRLLPVEEIGWLRDVDRRTGRLAGYLEARAEGRALGPDFTVDPDDFARTLLIGESDGNECILLLPGPSSLEWELWTYHPETGFFTEDTLTGLIEAALQV